MHTRTHRYTRFEGRARWRGRFSPVTRFEGKVGSIYPRVSRGTRNAMKPWDTRLSSPEAAISRRAEVVGRGEGVGGGREGGGRVSVLCADFHELRNRRRTARPWHRLSLIFYCPYSPTGLLVVVIVVTVVFLSFFEPIFENTFSSCIYIFKINRSTYIYIFFFF